MTTTPLPYELHNPAPKRDLPEELAKGRRLARAIGRELAGDTGYSDDLVAEAELGFVESLARFRAEDGVLLTTFAYPRMRGRALRALKRERRSHWLPNEPLAPAQRPSSTGPIRHNAEAKQLLRGVVDHLDRQERSVLNNYYYEGMTFAAIAERLGCSHSSAVRRHQKVIARLRAHAAV